MFENVEQTSASGDSGAPPADGTQPPQPGTNSSEGLWTVEEVTRYTKLKPSTIYDRTHTLSIPLLKLGRQLRFFPEEIKDWVLLGSTRGAAQRIMATRGRRRGR